MAKLYNITLTAATPPTIGYTVYYNSVNASTIATIGLAGGPATNLTKAQLVSPGLKVSIPDTATSIIMYNIECASSTNFTVPTSVTITASASNIYSTSITLNWITAPSGIATSYLIFKDGVLLTTLGNVSSYEVSSLTAGVTYNFSVQGKDVVGNVVGISNSVTVSLPLTSNVSTLNDTDWEACITENITSEFIVTGGSFKFSLYSITGAAEESVSTTGWIKSYNGNYWNQIYSAGVTAYDPDTDAYANTSVTNFIILPPGTYQYNVNVISYCSHGCCGGFLIDLV